MEKKEGNKFLTGFDRAVKTIEDYGVGICFAAIVLLSVVTVFYRYVLKSGILWSNEVQQILVVAMVMFGCAKATREGGHTELHAIVGFFPRKGRVFIRTLTSVAAIVFLVVFLYSGVKYALAAGNLKTIVLKLPYRYCYMLLPIGGILNIYEFIRRIPQRIMEDPKEEY